ncbi:MAG TPA: Na/Pi cotransporter family protein, partial [Tenericutes bacterium]|nr:Na/Pi cotransporter family protein [Mycoplasmatota bacterium]
MLNIFLFFITLVIGLVLFLFALNLMSITINRIINDKIKKLIFCFTDNSFYGLIIGTIITALIQSSSLVTVLTIALVKAKVINLKQSLAIIMGANIGTTMTTFMTGIDLEKFTMFFFIISIFSFFINKNTSNFFLSLALLLFGLGLMGISTKFIFKLD